MTPSRSLRLLAAAAVVLSLGACASRQKPAPALAAAPAETETPTPGGAGGSGDFAAARDLQSDLVARAGDRVFFALDSEALEAAAHDTLARQAAWLAENPNVRARIEGHADERGTREYNLALGARRAEAARRYLVGRGITPSRLDTISFGKEQPFAMGSDEAAWSQNRNAHTRVLDGR